jgi:hypothetical protein
MQNNENIIMGMGFGISAIKGAKTVTDLATILQPPKIVD